MNHQPEASLADGITNQWHPAERTGSALVVRSDNPGADLDLDLQVIAQDNWIAPDPRRPARAALPTSPGELEAWGAMPPS